MADVQQQNRGAAGLVFGGFDFEIFLGEVQMLETGPPHRVLVAAPEVDPRDVVSGDEGPGLGGSDSRRHLRSLIQDKLLTGGRGPDQVGHRYGTST